MENLSQPIVMENPVADDCSRHHTGWKRSQQDGMCEARIPRPQALE